jgi:asparagine N-glycosylation enzyme membrane subunit Stt3
MNQSQVFIAIAVLALLVIAVLFFLVKKEPGHKPLTPLASLAFACLIAGMVFGENRLLGYSLFGAGVVLAALDAVNKMKK